MYIVHNMYNLFFIVLWGLQGRTTGYTKMCIMSICPKSIKNLKLFLIYFYIFKKDVICSLVTFLLLQEFETRIRRSISPMWHLQFFFSRPEFLQLSVKISIYSLFFTIDLNQSWKKTKDVPLANYKKSKPQ